MATIDIKLTEEQKAQQVALEKEHGVTCYYIKAAGIECWIKEPSVADIDLFMAEQMNDKTQGSAALDLARRNLVAPNTDAEKVFAKKPGAIVPVANAYAKACGVAVDGYLGK